METGKNISGNELSRDEARVRMKKLLTGIATVGCGYLFGGTHAAFSAYPFGIAALCASGKGTLWLLAGLSARALTLGDTGFVYIALYVLTVGIRLFTSSGIVKFIPNGKGVFEEIPQLSVATATVAGGAVAVYEIIVGGISTESILFCLTNLVLIPILTFLFLGAMRAERDVFATLVRGESVIANSPLYYFVSLTAIGGTFVLSVGEYELFGISASGVCAAVAALLAARRFGAVRGGALGLVLGAAASAKLSPAIALLGAAFGALSPLSYPFALAAAVVASVGLESFVWGVSGFLSLAPELAVALALSWPLVAIPVKKEADEDKPTRKAATKSCDARSVHIDGLAASLTGLSSVIRTLGDDSPYPGELDYRATIDDACRKYCINCKLFDECWHRGDEGCAAAVKKISERYSSLGVAAVSELPRRLRDRCPCLEGLIADVSSALASLDAQYRGGRGSKLISLDYELISDLIAEASRADRIESREDIKAGLELRRAYRTLGIVSGDIAVYGERRRSIIAGGIHWEGKGISASDLHDVAETLCGCALSKPGFEIEEGMVTMQMSSVRRYSVEHASASLGVEETCGDRCMFFENGEDYHYTLICDGMGSGEEANRASGICGLFLEKLLSTGNSKSASLKLLNHALKNRGEECSSSIDLFELDLLYGRGSFVKSGAAPSYIRRGDKLFRLQSKTIPVGLLEGLDAQTTRFDVLEGDVVIMLSDGVCEASEDARWLTEHLASESFDDLAAAAVRILELAKEHATMPDDITVALTRVCPYTARAAA